MLGSQKEGPFRASIHNSQAGSSILGSLLLLAFAGGAAFTIEPLLPFDNLNQLAASPLALESTVPAEGTAQTEPKPGEELKDDLGSQTVQSGSRIYKVYWACAHVGPIKDIKKLTQKCSPGFKYAISVDADKGVINVTPSPSFPCLDGIGSEKVCSTGKLASKTCIPEAFQKTAKCEIEIKSETHDLPVGCNKSIDAGQTWDVESAISDKAQCLINQEAKFASPAAGTELEEKQKDILEGLGYGESTQNAILNSFKEETVKEDAVNDLQVQENEITRKLAALSECTTCAAEKATLETQKANITAKLQATQAELDGLRNNQQRLLAGEPPSSIPPTPLVPGPDTPSRLDFAGNTTGFNGTGIKPGTPIETSSGPIVAEPPKTPNPTGEIDWSMYDEGSSYGSAQGVRLNEPDPTETPVTRPSVSISDLVREAEEPNRLAEEELEQFPGLFQDVAQNQCKLGNCSIMHEVARQDLTPQEKAKYATWTSLVEAGEACSVQSIADCSKVAGIPHTKEGRREVCIVLKLGDCDLIGDYDRNVLYAEQIKTFARTGSFTEITHEQVVTIDSRGSILDVAEPTLKDKTETAFDFRSYAEGGTLGDVRAALAAADGVKEGTQTVYKVAGDICGVVGMSSSDASCSYYKRLADSQGGVLKAGQLPSYTRKQLSAIETAGEKIQTPFPAPEIPKSITAANAVSPAPRGVVSGNELAPPLDVGEIQAALAMYDEKVARGQTITAAERVIQAYDERVAQEARDRAIQAESQRLQGYANYLNQKKYIENSDTTKNMYNTMVELGRTPEEASQFVKEFADDGAWENWRAGQPITIKDANGKDTPGPGLVAANTYLSSGTERMIDSHIRTEFENARANAQSHVAYAEDLFTRSGTVLQKSLAETYLNEAQDRLQDIEERYSAYQAGTVSPELQQSINRIKQGDISGGAGARALSSLADVTGADADEYGSRINLDRVDGTLAYAPRWIVGEALSGTASGFSGLLQRFGAPGFGTSAQQDLLSAIDPHGADWQFLADATNVGIPSSLAVKPAVSIVRSGVRALVTNPREAGGTIPSPLSTGGTFPTQRIEPTFGAPPVQSPVAPFSNSQSFSVDDWARDFDSSLGTPPPNTSLRIIDNTIDDIDALRIEGAVMAIQPPLAPPTSSFTPINWGRVQTNTILNPANTNTPGLAPLDTNKIRSIFNQAPVSVPALSPSTNVAPRVYFDARPSVMRWRDSVTGQFAPTLAPAPIIVSPTPPANFSPINFGAVNRLRNAVGLPTLQ